MQPSCLYADIRSPREKAMGINEHHSAAIYEGTSVYKIEDKQKRERKFSRIEYKEWANS